MRMMGDGCSLGGQEVMHVLQYGIEVRVECLAEH